MKSPLQPEQNTEVQTYIVYFLDFARYKGGEGLFPSNKTPAS